MIFVKHHHFVRSGNITINVGRLNGAGVNGRGWSSMAETYTNSSTARAYDFFFGISSVSPSDDYHRWYGFPLRCLAD